MYVRQGIRKGLDTVFKGGYRRFYSMDTSKHDRAWTHDIGNDSNIFRYTSGRWIYNERQRLDERYVKFDIKALIQAAARAIDRDANDVRSFVKLAEGGFNRVFQITMRDGLEIIARLPYKIAQPAGLAVASEVATMNYLRERGFPIPRVYTYSHDDHNPVGAEYILMEKVGGRLLGDVWFDLTDKQRIRLLSEIVGIEKRLFQMDLPACGSIFHQRDLPAHFGRRSLVSLGDPNEYCVGPSVSLRSWFGDRSKLTIDRGPAASPTEVLQGAAAIEMEYLKRHAKPRYPFERVHRDINGFQKASPDDHLRSLEQFTQVADHLVPREAWLQKPTLRHPDLNPNNVFISEDAEILSIIDWQHSEILPLFLCAGIPKHIQNYGDPDSEALNKPQLSPDFHEWDEEDQAKDLELYRKRHLHFYYVGATAKLAAQHFDAMMHEGGMFRRRIFHNASAPWEGDNVTLKAELVCLARRWEDIVPAPGDGSPRPVCPIAFADEEAEKALADMAKLEEADYELQILRNVVGAGTDGWVSNERYDEVSAQARAMKESALAGADDDAERNEVLNYWPFDDYDESQ